jgi:hypothetical protein
MKISLDEHGMAVFVQKNLERNILICIFANANDH